MLNLQMRVGGLLQWEPGHSPPHHPSRGLRGLVAVGAVEAEGQHPVLGAFSVNRRDERESQNFLSYL